MKRTLAAMLTALMLLPLLPLASLPAVACTGFSIACTVTSAYVGQQIKWFVYDVQGAGPFQYRLDVYKDGQSFDEAGYSSNNFRYYTLPLPGRYKVVVYVKGSNSTFIRHSDEITVTARPITISKVEPVSATSVKITWNAVPGAVRYDLWISGYIDSGRNFVGHTTGTSFTYTNLQAGIRKFFWVAYFMPAPAFSHLSPAASGVPMAKTSITSITSPSKGRVMLVWSTAAGASGYQVAMATTSNGSYKTVRILPGTTVTFSGLKSGSSLFFKVRPYRRIYTTTYWGVYSMQRGIKVK